MISYIIIGVLIIICIILFCNNKKRNTEVNKAQEEKNQQLLQEQKQLEDIIATLKNNADIVKTLYDKYNTQVQEIEQEVKQKNADLRDKQEELNKVSKEVSVAQSTVDGLRIQERNAKESIADTTKLNNEMLKSRERVIEEAFARYCENLDHQYEQKDLEYAELNKKLEEVYNEHHKKLIAEAGKEEEELAQIRATRAAAIEALRREDEIKADPSHYCIQVSDEDKSDIERFNSIKKTLNKPRVLSMLIWQTYFAKPLKALAAQILGPTTVTGIYKITNIITGEVYIGQSVDIASRFNQHAKAGLGIDTPAGNKLYKAMIEYGLWSFSWELLEKCTASELNAKERFYIDLYDSVNFGYNSTAGNK